MNVEKYTAYLEALAEIIATIEAFIVEIDGEMPNDFTEGVDQGLGELKYIHEQYETWKSTICKE